LAQNVAIAQNESAVRMFDEETITSNTEKIVENPVSINNIQANKATLVKQTEVQQVIKTQKISHYHVIEKPSATSGKFLAKIKKNLKPQKQTQENKITKKGKFWAILFGLISIITFLLLFSEQSWVYWFISMISMTIALLINSDVATIMAMIACVVSLVLLIIGLTTSNPMALLLGLLMLIYIAGIISLA
jgi:hypothetical protein